MYDRFCTSNIDADLHRDRRGDTRLTRRRAILLGAAAGIGAVTSVDVHSARAVLSLDLNRGNPQPIPIALPDFLAGTPTDGQLSRSISQIITANLKRSGLFAPIDQAAFIEKITNTDVQPRYPDWRAINAQALVTGRVTRQPDGRIKVEFRLWDVFGAVQVSSPQYFSTTDSFRRSAHLISDPRYERLTGEKGYFDT